MLKFRVQSPADLKRAGPFDVFFPDEFFSVLLLSGFWIRDEVDWTSTGNARYSDEELFRQSGPGVVVRGLFKSEWFDPSKYERIAITNLADLISAMPGDYLSPCRCTTQLGCFRRVRRGWVLGSGNPVSSEEALSQVVPQTSNEGEPIAALWRKKGAQGTQARQRNKKARSQKFKVQTAADLDAAEIGDIFLFDHYFDLGYYTVTPYVLSETGWREAGADAGSGLANEDLLSEATGVVIRKGSYHGMFFRQNEYSATEVSCLSDVRAAIMGDFLVPNYGDLRGEASYLKVPEGWQFGEDQPISDEEVFERMIATAKQFEWSNRPSAILWRRKAG